MNLKTDNRYYTALTAYLLGMELSKYDISFVDHFEIPNEVENNDDAMILRNLCMLRNNFLNSYDVIDSFFTTTLRNIIEAPEVNQNCVKYLEAANINLRITNATSADYIRHLSNLINEYARKVSNSDLLPKWATSVLRDCYCNIFTVSKRTSGMTLSKTYERFRLKYPYQLFVGFNISEYQHNLLYRDSTLFTNIQELSGIEDVTSYDRFLMTGNSDFESDDNKTRGTYSVTREEASDSFSDFLSNSSKILIIVDCENTHVDTVVAVVNEVSRSNIKGNKYKIVLVDDERCPADWEIIKLFTNFEVEHIEMHRLKSQKSTVDMRLALIAQREVLKNNIDGVVLVSSDSDYFCLMESMQETDDFNSFFVIFEGDRVGEGYLSRLNKWGIGSMPASYLDINDFVAEKSKLYRSWILNCLNANYSFSVSKILDLVSQSVNISNGDREALGKLISDKLTLVSRSNGDISFSFK